MLHRLNVLLVIFLLGHGLHIPAQDKNDYTTDIKTYLDHLSSEEFSGTILVARNEEILEKRAYGMANIEFAIKNQTDTKFNIASITKMFTAVATLQLVERGELELKQPIGTYLPAYPNKSVRDSVTIHHLLTHTAGTNNFYVGKFLESNKLKYRSVRDFLPLFAMDPLLSSPGEKYHYSASGFVILGLIIEAISGKSYYQFLKDHIFNPAQMFNTAELEIDALVYNKADGYTSLFGESRILRRNDNFLSKASPGGFHYSTVEDLFNFSRALRNYELLNKETTNLMFLPKVKGYNTHIGYGIDVDQRYNQTILAHSGGWYGVRAEIMDFMEDNYTVVVLSNIDDDGKSGASEVIGFFKVLIAN